MARTGQGADSSAEAGSGNGGVGRHHLFTHISRLWRRHSLSIVLTAVGALCIAVSLALPDGHLFDTLNGCGTGLLTTGLAFFAYGRLREVHKPEDDPHQP